MVSLPGPSFWTFRKPASYSSLESLQHHVSKTTLLSYVDCVRGPIPSHRWNSLHRCASRVWEDARLFTNACSSMDHPLERTTCIHTYFVRLSYLASRLPSTSIRSLRHDAVGVRLPSTSIRSVVFALEAVANAPLWEFVYAPLRSMRLDQDEVVQARGDERTIADRHAWMAAPHVARGRPRWRCWCSRRCCGCTDAGDVQRGAGGGARERETRPGT